MRRWNLPQVNTKVMCAVLTAAMVMTGFTACGGSTTASAASTEALENKETIAPESTESTESGEEKVESYLGQITAIDGNVISIALAEKPEAPNGEAPTGRPLMIILPIRSCTRKIWTGTRQRSPSAPIVSLRRGSISASRMKIRRSMIITLT